MNPKIRRIIDQMSTQLHRKQSLNDLARSSKLSRSRVCYLFKTQTGKSPGQYLKALRLETARGLLENTSLSVKEIRARVGMYDESHFVRDFTRVHGVTPSRYREQCTSPIEPSAESNRDTQISRTIGHRK